ncbi:MAG: lipid-A-disaccharide synthase [Pseudomonadota bacterium]
MSTAARKVFLIAGEASGDALGAALMARLRALDPGLEFLGIGGPKMEHQGLQSLFPMQELSVMGLTEVLPRLPALLRRARETVEAIATLGASALITIDSPDFCLHVAKRAKAANPELKTIHYVAPTIWAWRPGRATKMAGFIDHVLALYPFEPPLMHDAGMGCDFVGHPVVAEPTASAEDIAAFRDVYGLDDAPILLVLPGSRASEVKRLSPIFGAAVAKVLAKAPGARVVVPAAPDVAGEVSALLAGWVGAPVILDPREMSAAAFAREKRAAFAASEVALAASGTVSLELAAVDTPMVIAYDMAPISRMLIGAMLKVDTVTLVNLVSETRSVPEFLGRKCQPEPIAEALLTLLREPALREPQFDAMEETMTRLGRGGEPPGLRAARAVLQVLG